jgi:hypothetical protein
MNLNITFSLRNILRQQSYPSETVTSSIIPQKLCTVPAPDWHSSKACRVNSVTINKAPLRVCRVFQCRWQLRGDHHDKGDSPSHRQSGLETSGHLQVFLWNRCRVLPIRRANLLHEVRFLDVRWLPGLYIAVYRCILLCLALYCCVLLYIAVSCFILLCLAAYCYVLLHIAMSCCILLCLALYCYVLLHIAVSCCILLCLALYCYVLLYIAVSCFILLCLAAYCYVLLHIAVYCCLLLVLLYIAAYYCILKYIAIYGCGLLYIAVHCSFVRRSVVNSIKPMHLL